MAHRGGAAAGGRGRGADRQGRPAARPTAPGDHPVHRARHADPGPDRAPGSCSGRSRRPVGAARAPAGAGAGAGRRVSTPRRRRAVLRASLARFLTVEVPTRRCPSDARRRCWPRPPTTTATSTTTSSCPTSPRAGWRSGWPGRTGASAMARVLIVDPAADDRAGQRRGRHDPGHRADPRPGVPARHPAHRRARAHPAARGGRALPGAGRPEGGSAPADLLRLHQPVEPARDAAAVRVHARVPAGPAAAHRLGPVARRAVPDRRAGAQGRAGPAVAGRAPGS